MEYSDALLSEALPSEPPPLEYVPREVLDEIERTVDRKDFDRSILVARSTQWTYAMFAELRLGRFFWSDADWPLEFLWRGTFGDAAIGLLEPKAFGADFGLTLSIPGYSPYRSGVRAGLLEFPRLNRSFRVALQRSEAEDHSLPHPQGATSAAWAQCNRTRQWGVITAGHCVGSATGRKVSLTGGAAGRVARSFYPVIDAAFVQTMEEPERASVMAISRFPAAGQAVRVGCRSTPVNRTVVRVEDNMGVVRTLSRSALLYTDQCCSPGDSGALVQASGGAAVGLYLGSLDTPDIGSVGRVLSFEQALFALDVTAFD